MYNIILFIYFFKIKKINFNFINNIIYLLFIKNIIKLLNIINYILY
jgi:hypothetical protein